MSMTSVVLLYHNQDMVSTEAPTAGAARIIRHDESSHRPASQSFTTRSRPALASQRPSGAKARS
jgi:hypothetical protein